MQMQHFGEAPTVVAGAARRFEFGHRDVDGALPHQRSGKRKIADDQAVAEFPSELEHLRASGGDVNLRHFCRRQTQKCFSLGIESEKLREGDELAELYFASGKQLAQK